MRLVNIPDDGGDIMSCVERNGYIFPKFFDTRGLDNITSINIRDDDVLILSYPKSGTHWIFEITRELLTGEITEDDITMESTFIDMQPEDVYANKPSPRILCTHIPLDQLPPDVLKKKIKIIYIRRNPKDVAVSFYKFMKCSPYLNYDGRWENFFRPYFLGKFIYGSWFDHVRKWHTVQTANPDLPAINLSYEDFKKDQMGEMEKICLFLGVERNKEFCNRVRQNTGLEKMKSQKSADKRVFRKGQVGDWKSMFTVAQNEWFDQLYQEKMKDCPLLTELKDL